MKNFSLIRYKKAELGKLVLDNNSPDSSLLFFLVLTQEGSTQVEAVLKTGYYLKRYSTNSVVLPTDIVLPITISSQDETLDLIKYLFKIPRFIIAKEYISRLPVYYKI